MGFFEILPGLVARKARDKYGSPNRMAQELNISQSSLSKFLNGRVDSRWSLVAKVLDGLGATLSFPGDRRESGREPCILETTLINMLQDRRNWVGLQDMQLNAELNDLVLGRRELSVCACNRLCEALGLSCVELLGKAQFELHQKGVRQCGQKN
ncbi:MAG: helix-turn-helix domain-containing protein [Desulfovibrionales bacterium]